MNRRSYPEADCRQPILLDLNYQVSDCYFKREIKNIFNENMEEAEPDSPDACLRQFNESINDVVIDP